MGGKIILCVWYTEVIREVVFQNVGNDYIFVTLWSDYDTINYNSILLSRTSILKMAGLLAETCW